MIKLFKLWNCMSVRVGSSCRLDSCPIERTLACQNWIDKMLHCCATVQQFYVWYRGLLDDGEIADDLTETRIHLSDNVTLDMKALRQLAVSDDIIFTFTFVIIVQFIYWLKSDILRYFVNYRFFSLHRLKLQGVLIFEVLTLGLVFLGVERSSKKLEVFVL